MKPPLLSAKQIHKRFKMPGASIDVLKGVSLELFAGESVAIMGASGEGKSTLLQILGTLDTPTSGELSIVGKSALTGSRAPLRNRHIGFVFQSFNLLENYSVLQNVLMPALISGASIQKGSAAYKRAVQLLEQLGLSSRIHFTTKLLSGGEKQRVALARALLNKPELLLADEPSGNLDHNTSQQIHQLLLGSIKEQNRALVIVTHDPALAALCDRTLILSDGLLQQKEGPMAL